MNTITTDRPEMAVHDTLNTRTQSLTMNIEGVSKQYNTKNWGLRDFTLELRSGVLGLLGPNGAGKSTLMRILATITKATSGRVTWNGTDIAKAPDVLRAVLGYLPQDFGVYPNLTVVEFHCLDRCLIHGKGKTIAALIRKRSNSKNHPQSVWNRSLKCGLVIQEPA
jgi:ABC-type multidrug transport system ATPase subunit